MKRRPYERSLKTRVPVSTAGHRSPEKESHTRPVGLNKRHEARLVVYLVDHYGWTFPIIDKNSLCNSWSYSYWKIRISNFSWKQN